MKRTQRTHRELRFTFAIQVRPNYTQLVSVPACNIVTAAWFVCNMFGLPLSTKLNCVDKQPIAMQ